MLFWHRRYFFQLMHFYFKNGDRQTKHYYEVVPICFDLYVFL